MDMLVSTDWLAQKCSTSDLVILDATAHLPNAGRDPRAEYLHAHIPGARFLDLPSLKNVDSSVPNAIPTRDQLGERLRSLGVNSGDRIVLYDDSAVKTSARAWFMLRHYGVDRVAILDGGLAKWKAEGRDLETGPADNPRGKFDTGEPSSRIRTKADMLANIATDSEQVLDARDAGRFSGEVEDTIHNLPTGHIPGSHNLPFNLLFAPDGTFLPKADIKKAFVKTGIDLARPVTTTCGSGVTASVLLFALELIGKPGGALYDGSWSEWGADPETPNAAGAGR
ncbi:sulfurtransferase [Altererythrobacter sp. MF3-039]|uniref:sulfurtransferase n=1 Tax=Altererythrobacter sp. MF3-039 TaxID=3252901 RepID=UPI00390C6F1C